MKRNQRLRQQLAQLDAKVQVLNFTAGKTTVAMMEFADAYRMAEPQGQRAQEVSEAALARIGKTSK
jgi:hypothetical protein